MSDQFIGRLMAFKGEDEYVPQTEIMVEVTEVEDGHVELAFDVPGPGKPRIYLSVPLAEVVRRSMAGDKE
jgi:hypothetical protein